MLLVFMLTQKHSGRNGRREETGASVGLCVVAEELVAGRPWRPSPASQSHWSFWLRPRRSSPAGRSSYRVCLGPYGGQLCLLSLLLHGRPELKAAVEEKPEVEAGRTELGAAELRPVNYGRHGEQSWPGRGGQRQRSSSASPPPSSV